MAPIAMADKSALSKESVEPMPLEAISHGPTLPGIPVFNKLESKRQWMCGLLHTSQFSGETDSDM